MITGVGLQGFGRLALAKVYVKTEAVINEAADAAPASEADRISTSSGRNDDPRGVDGSGCRGGARGGSGGGAVSERREDSSGLLKLNGVSSSIGGIRVDNKDARPS